MTCHRPSKEEGAWGSLGWSVCHIWVDLPNFTILELASFLIMILNDAKNTIVAHISREGFKNEK
jgi:hypothetical protein